jgi:hypothetical protein
MSDNQITSYNILTNLTEKDKNEKRRKIKMKRRIMVVLIVVLGLSFILPAASFAWRGGWGPGAGYRGGWGPYRPYGWSRPGVYVGTAFVNPWYFPPPVYVSPPVVVYSNPVPPPAYAYPDPGLTGQYAGGNPPGEWITVPGQWVNGQWIPSHQAWVPVNP